MRSYKSILALVLCTGFVAACASEAPALNDDGTAVVSGRDTKDLDPAEARRTALLEAARITVDHGFPYFVVVHRDVWTPGGSMLAGNDSQIRPGDDVTIKVYNKDEIPSGTREVFDAQRMLTTGVPAATASAAPSSYGTYGSLAPAYTPPAGTQPSTYGAPRATPRCTAYGCDW